MGLPKPEPLFTIDEYLAYERSSEDRHEYIDGHVYGMAGESGEHGDISANLVAILVSQLKGTPCRVRTKDTKVRSGPIRMSGKQMKGMFSYPDIVVICGEPEYHDAHRDTILNPAVIVEILSPSTEDFDRDKKFKRYQKWNPTLKDYLLVSQDEPAVEQHTRKAGGTWSCRRHSGTDAEVVVASISCTLKLADVYDRIQFAKVQR